MERDPQTVTEFEESDCPSKLLFVKTSGGGGKS